jgi:hypothetical protein
VNKYIARMSYLMRQGQPANQVAILLPEDDVWASFSPGHTTMTGALAKLITPELMSTILSAGYNVDFIDADAIDKVGLGTHQVVVIPPTDRIPLATLKKLDDWVLHHGGKVISVEHAPTVDSEGRTSAELTKLLEKLPFVPDNENLGRALTQETTPDLQLAKATDADRSTVGFVRRKLADADLYFVVNTSNQPVQLLATFATTFTRGERLDADTGQFLEASPQQHQSLALAPYESTVFVFHNGTDVGAGIHSANIPSNGKSLDLSTDWKVTFAGTGKFETETQLKDWTANPETLHYSGEVVYAKDFKLDTKAKSIYLEVDGGEALPLPPKAGDERVLMANGLPDPRVTRTGPGMHAYFEPPIHEAALVVVNGQAAGAPWHPPYRLDVSKYLKVGENHIEIHVFNTALNAWSALPPHDFKPLIDKYGAKFQMQDMDQVKPVSSGILGTIKLVEMEPGK